MSCRRKPRERKGTAGALRANFRPRRKKEKKKMKAKELVWLALIGGLTAMAATAPAHAGACILEETACIDVPQDVCDAMGGVYLGDDTDCEGWPSEPLPKGACCFEDPDKDCEDLTEPECFAADGEWSAGSGFRQCAH